MNSDVEQELEEARARYVWGTVASALWTSLVVVGALAVLFALTVLLGWQRQLLPNFLGLLAGASLAVAMAGSSGHRAVTGLVVGGVTLPLVAAYLAGQSPEGLRASSAILSPFLAHGTIALVGALSISTLWRRRPMPPPPRDRAAGRPPASEGGPA
jgi:hypothetical protein